MVYKYSLEELKKIAETMADSAEPPVSFFLEGDIGAGKTTFSKFFITKILLDKNQQITSPTFNIIQIYETIKGPLWHVDLYRLKRKDELFELGIIEAMHEYLCLIEWPGILKNFSKGCNVKILNLNP